MILYRYSTTDGSQFIVISTGNTTGDVQTIQINDLQTNSD